MMEEEKLGVDEVTVEEDVVMVIKAKVVRNKPWWLAGITVKNLPNWLSIVPSLHLLWSSSLAMSAKVVM